MNKNTNISEEGTVLNIHGLEEVSQNMVKYLLVMLKPSTNIM